MKKCKNIKDKTYRWKWGLDYHGLKDAKNAIKNYFTKNYAPEKYEIECIRKVLNNKKKEKVNPLLEDMLLHSWPPIEEVDAVILTNRILSNNVFKKKRRTNVKVYR